MFAGWWFGICSKMSYLEIPGKIFPHWFRRSSSLELRMMKSAKQTEQKIATLEATLLQRRDYLDSIKVRWGWSLKDLEG